MVFSYLTQKFRVEAMDGMYGLAIIPNEDGGRYSKGITRVWLMRI